jgi:molybdenum cofactor synthesis domain-containing protein
LSEKFTSGMIAGVALMRNETDAADMLNIENALQIMLAHTPLLGTEETNLTEAAGRILRREALSDMNLPPFDRARMDGYAVRAADLAGASAEKPVRLRSIGEIAAGGSSEKVVGQGEAVRIMTGAPVPPGADAVQKIEVIRVSGDDVEFTEPVKTGQFITPCGIEAKQGEIMVKSGTRLTPSITAVLASFGHAVIEVSFRPRLTLLSTGSELVEAHLKPGPSQIRNSNTYSLHGYATAAGAEIVSASIVRDDFEATKKAISEAAARSDVVMLSGGVSMGDYDLVRPVLEDLGAKIRVQKVAMHPGKPTVFARLDRTVILGLPGNPVSVSVAFHIFALPVLLKMQGANELILPRIDAYVTRKVKGAPPRRSHQPARLIFHDGRVKAEPLKWSGSSDLVAFMQANALIVVPEESDCIEEGELAEVILLPS